VVVEITEIAETKYWNTKISIITITIISFFNGSVSGKTPTCENFFLELSLTNQTDVCYRKKGQVD
jgi:hypothetical protein